MREREREGEGERREEKRREWKEDTYANARDAVSALHGRRAKPLRDYRLLRQSSRDFETVIWPRNLRKCRRWLEFSDKRDGPWRDKEREAKGMRERGVGGAKVGRGGGGGKGIQRTGECGRRQRKRW